MDRMTRTLLYGVGLLTHAFLSVPAQAEPSITLLADSCAMCHGTDGKAVGKMEELYGKDAAKLEDEMLEMKRENKGRIMAPMMKAYSDAQIRAIAQHFESLAGKKSAGAP